MKHVIACDLRFEDHINTEVGRALKEKLPLRKPVAPLAVGDTDSGALEAALDREPSAYDSHPSPRDRIRWVERLSAAVQSEDETGKDAWSLFEHREHHEREVTLSVYQQLAESGVRPPALPKPEQPQAGG